MVFLIITFPLSPSGASFWPFFPHKSTHPALTVWPKQIAASARVLSVRPQLPIGHSRGDVARAWHHAKRPPPAAGSLSDTHFSPGRSGSCLLRAPFGLPLFAP